MLDTDIPSDPEPTNLRFLRRLVTILTATMILGVLTIIVLLVIRLNAGTAPLQLPSSISLPAGTTAIAVTQTSSRILIVTNTDEILVFDPTGKSLEQTISLEGSTSD